MNNLNVEKFKEPIGYWKTKNGNENYPEPVVDSITDVVLYIYIVDKLVQCFAQASEKYSEYNNRKRVDHDNYDPDLYDSLYGIEFRLIAYRGYSNCRICGCRNGSNELEIKKGDTIYMIPEGYLHYLIDHKVGIDTKLLGVFDV